PGQRHPRAALTQERGQPGARRAPRALEVVKKVITTLDNARCRRLLDTVSAGPRLPRAVGNRQEPDNVCLHVPADALHRASCAIWRTGALRCWAWPRLRVSWRRSSGMAGSRRGARARTGCWSRGINSASGPTMMAWTWAVPRWPGSPAITAIALLNCANSRTILL